MVKKEDLIMILKTKRQNYINLNNVLTFKFKGEVEDSEGKIWVQLCFVFSSDYMITDEITKIQFQNLVGK